MKWVVYVGETVVATGDAADEPVSLKVFEIKRTEAGLGYATMGVELASPTGEPRVFVREQGVEP